ncbi:MAG TPA: class I SAM-dependent methyltransferase [Solimonas sp.]|nr:class I SAM-dependent methyltransferase [Solimonas sp.]
MSRDQRLHPNTRVAAYAAPTSEVCNEPVIPKEETRTFALEQRAGRLCLRALHHPDYGPICADWNSPEMRRRIAAGKRQLLARAAGLPRRPHAKILDATAGLGRDGFVLAALGARLTMAERHPQLAALLRDAQARASGGALEVLEIDARTLLAGERCWDVVYLDPMYPHQGRTALPQKEMQLFRELTGGDTDSGDLLALARARAHDRVVVKRPLHVPPLGGAPPSLELRGTQARFDIYLIPRP